MKKHNSFLVKLQEELAKTNNKQGSLFDDEGMAEKDLFGKYDDYDEAQDEITKLRKANQELGQKADEHKLRISSFKKLFWLMVAWLVACFIVVVLSGLSFQVYGIYVGLVLSDSVLIALLGSTTINVLGIFAIAAKWLFPKQ